MIPEFERLAKNYPDEPCFTFMEKDGSRFEISYDKLRLKAAALAIMLQKRGIGRDGFVSVDMENCPAFVVCAIAAAYGGFALVALNHRLTDDEKASRLADLRLLQDCNVTVHLDERQVEHMLNHIDLTDGEEPVTRGLFGRKSKKKPISGRAGRGEAPTLGEIIHFAERGTAFFDLATRALLLFTSGTSGKPKAVSLSWGNLCGAAEASNASLNDAGQGMWQLALPMFHIGGFEIFVRSILNAVPFLLYRHFDADRVLSEAAEYGATHLSVVDKMLQDLITADHDGLLQHYTCILLGGGTANPATLVDAVAHGASVYASYGMTETSSQIASSPVTEEYDGGLKLLPGYEVEIINPDEQGYGQLAVRGPGIFNGYLNARAAFTADGFFLTGDTASFKQGKLRVRERVSDMFVSGGENIYPAEIQEKLMRVPGVLDAYAFGVIDETWGRRPVAFVERDASTIAGSPQRFAAEVEKSLEQRLSKLYRPKHLCVLDRFPRIGIGKTDREGLRQIYDERIEVHEVRLYRIRQKLVAPFKTAKTTMHTRESAIIEVIDADGRTGIGECVAFSTDWYLPETLTDDLKVLEEHLIPLVLQQIYLHPREVSVCFDECTEAAGFPLAKGALEPALWDLYGKIVGEPLWRLIGEEAGETLDASVPVRLEAGRRPGAVASSADYGIAVPAGAVFGIMPVQKTLEAVRQAVDSGYTRVKLKVKPGDDIARVRAVREAFPDLTIMIDANQAYTERDLDTLKAFDSLAIRCIEEPLDPYRLPQVGPTDFFARLTRLQKDIKTPVCLDESMITPDDIDRALESPGLRCFALKIAKWGGVDPALRFYQQARERGIDLWMGGMYETGVSKNLHAAFETLAGITIPGDLSSTSRHFATDICSPAFEAVDGLIVLNQSGFETGLGCTLDRDVLARVLVAEKTWKRNP